MDNSFNTKRPAKVVLLLAAAALTLGGCDKISGLFGADSKAPPTGQVVAKIDGEEVTQLEVNAELQGANIPPNMTRRDAEKIALNNIVTRRMLANVARKQELDKKPDFLLQERRMNEQLLVQSLAKSIAAKVQAPTRDEANIFMENNPSMFANRKFFIMDQIQFLRPDNIDKLNLEGAKTMAQVEAILNANNIQFRRQPASLDALGANPDFVKQVTGVLAKNPDELFMFATRPQGAPAPVIVVNQVKETRVQPFTGDKARDFAINYLRNERIQNALKAEVEAQQKERAQRVVFQEGWEPPANKPVDHTALAGAGNPEAPQPALPSSAAKGTSPSPSPAPATSATAASTTPAAAAPAK